MPDDNSIEDVSGKSPVARGSVEIPEFLRRRGPAVPRAEKIAMAVEHELGESTVKIAAKFGYDPRTVRKAIKDVPEDFRRMVGLFASEELAGLSHAVARQNLEALLSRDPNRLRRNRDGEEVPGWYAVSDAELHSIAVGQGESFGKHRGAARMGGGDDTGGDSSNPVRRMLDNYASLSDALSRIPEGQRVTLEVQQTARITTDQSGSGA